MKVLLKESLCERSNDTKIAVDARAVVQNRRGEVNTGEWKSGCQRFRRHLLRSSVRNIYLVKKNDI